MADETRFSVKYDGTAVRDGSIPIKDIAPALLALGKYFEQVYNLTSADQTKIEIRVRGIRQGSIGIDFEIVKNAYVETVSLFSSGSVSALANAITIGGFAMMLLQWLKGRTPQTIEIGDRQIKFLLDGNAFCAPLGVEVVFEDTYARSELYKIVKPLELEGIELFELQTGMERKTTFTVRENEIKYLQDPVALNQVHENVIDDFNRDVTVRALKIDFRPNQAWRISEGGDDEYSAVIKDLAFAKKMQTGEVTFSNGDIFRIKLRTIQTKSAKGDLRFKYEILKVVEHSRVMKQSAFSLEDE